MKGQCFQLAKFQAGSVWPASRSDGKRFVRGMAGGPTMRAADGWESTRFTGIFLALSLYCSQTVTPPAAANAGRWAASLDHRLQFVLVGARSLLRVLNDARHADHKLIMN